MKRRRFEVFIGSALPMLLIGSLQADTSLAAERPDFSGKWQLNEELSENPRDLMTQRRGGGGRGGSGGGKGRGTGSREDMQSRLQARAERVKALEIVHQDPELVLGFADGTSRTIFTDERQTVDDLDAGVIATEAKWRGNSQVVLRSESAHGSRITEIYELDEAGDMLFVTTKIEGEGRRPDMNFKRVYDRALVDITVEPDPDEQAG